MADLDGSRGEDALGAVERGKGLRELRHAPANGGQSFHQDDVVARVGDIEGSLHAGDTGTDDECALARRLV